MLPEPGELPIIDARPHTIKTTPTGILVVLAAVAGWQAYGGDDLDPRYLRWVEKWVRKYTWYRLRRRHPAHYDWGDWKTARGPHK